MKTTIIMAVTAAVALLAAPAGAHTFQGDNELTTMLGGQVGVHDAPGGGKLFTEYGYRLSRMTWLDLQLDFAFGGGRACFVDRSGFVTCDRLGAEVLDLLAGAKWKFTTRNEKLVPYAKAGGGLAFLFYPARYDDGIAPVVRGGGGLKYFVTPSVGVGGETTATLGPGFYGCGPDCTVNDLYFAWDLAVGAEFNF